MGEVYNRYKDIQYSSRIATHIQKQQQIHQLRHVIAQLAAHIPEADRKSNDIMELESYGCRTQMHVVRLLAPSIDRESHIKDIDFSSSGIHWRWKAGFADAQAALQRAPWIGQFDPLAGIILHEQISCLPDAAQ
jgi:NTE family protein